MRRLSWWLEAAAARGALSLLRALGPAAASDLGGWMARSLGPLLPVSRVADANLRRAFPELDAAARARVVRGVWDNLGRTAGELPHVPALHPTASGPGWVIEGAEHVAALAALGGPAIMVSAHLGNWEVLPRVAGLAGIALAPVYRAADNPYVDRLLLALRAQAAGRPIRHFAKGSPGARGALLHLRDGGALAMLVDQKMNDGIAARFFGRTAMTAPAAAALALRFSCPVVPAFAERIGPARFRVVCEPPLPLPHAGAPAAQVMALTQAINDRIETWVRARPEQWLWLHRRWPKET